MKNTEAKASQLNRELSLRTSGQSMISTFLLFFSNRTTCHTQAPSQLLVTASGLRETTERSYGEQCRRDRALHLILGCSGQRSADQSDGAISSFISALLKRMQFSRQLNR